jgi:hypothetical protein
MTGWSLRCDDARPASPGIMAGVNPHIKKNCPASSMRRVRRIVYS